MLLQKKTACRARANGVLFLFGGGVYAIIELLYRGRTYFSMFCAGGASLLLIDRWCNKRRGKARVVTRCMRGASAVTLVELLFGLLFNRAHKVWDYSNLPCNLLGQICLQYSAAWAVLSLPAMFAASFIRRALR